MEFCIVCFIVCFLHYFWHSSFFVKSFRLFCSKLLAFLGFSDRSFWWSFVLSFIFLADAVYWFVFSFFVFWYFFVYYLFERYSLFVLWFVFSTIFDILRFLFKSFRFFCSKFLAFLGYSDRSFWWSFVLSFIFLVDVVYWFVFSFSHFYCVLIFFVYNLFGIILLICFMVCFLHYFWHSSFSVQSFRLFCSKFLAFLGYSDRSFWWSFVLSFIFLADAVYWFVFSSLFSECPYNMLLLFYIFNGSFLIPI